MTKLNKQLIASLEAKERPYKIADGAGLCILVNPDGSKYWRFRYRFDGKEKGLSIGVYPQINLEEAREKRGWARRLLANGLDPSLVKQEIKAEQKANILVRRNNLIAINRLVSKMQDPSITIAQLIKIEKILLNKD